MRKTTFSDHGTNLSVENCLFDNNVRFLVFLALSTYLFLFERDMKKSFFVDLIKMHVFGKKCLPPLAARFTVKIVNLK